MLAIVALKSGAGKVKQQLLKSFVRVRRALQSRVSSVASQSAPLTAKQLKTLPYS
jgi:hypothetical protein